MHVRFFLVLLLLISCILLKYIFDVFYSMSPYLASMQSSKKLGRLTSRKNGIWIFRKPGTWWIDGNLCMGFANQRMGLINMVAFAWLYDLVLILPSAIDDFDWFQRVNSSISENRKVSIATFYDVAFLRAFLTDIGVRYTESTPKNFNLRIQHFKGKRDIFEKLRRDQSGIIHFECLHKTFIWDDPLLLHLRNRMESILLPSVEISEHIRIALSALGTSFTAVHGRIEEDWIDYCESEAKNVTVSGVQSFRDCYISPGEIAKIVANRGISKDQLVYLASGNPKLLRDAFLAEGFNRVLSRDDLLVANNLSISDGREIRATFDFYICSAATVFFGNVFSSFSYEVKAKRSAEYRLSYYYTLDGKCDEKTCDVEAHRWDVSTMEVPPSLRLPSHSLDKPIGKANVEEIDSSKYIKVTGFVVDKFLSWRTTAIQIQLSDGIPFANIPISSLNCLLEPASNLKNCTFTALVPVRLVSKSRTISVRAFLSNSGAVELAGSPLIVDYFDDRPVIWLYFPNNKHSSGGPEALHQIHNMANKLGYRSLFFKGNEAYRTTDSIFVSEFSPQMLNHQDIVIVPEGAPAIDILPSVRQRGVRVIVYYLGQHLHWLSDKQKLINFFDERRYMIPLCLSEHFVNMYWCSEKSVVTTPMAETFYEDASAWRANGGLSQKENIILFDWDPTEEMSSFDPSQVKLPSGMSLVHLKGYSRHEVVNLYKKAKVIFDTYSTGMERASYESCLYDVVVIPPSSGPANNFATYPIDPVHRWSLWNTTQLSSLIVSAINNYPQSLATTKKFKDFTIQMRHDFPSQTASFVSSNGILLRTVALTHEDKHAALVLALGFLVNYPLARVEILVDSSAYFYFEFMPLIRDLSLHGYYDSIHVVQIDPLDYSLGMICSILTAIEGSSAYGTFVVIVPPSSLFVGSDLTSIIPQVYASTTDYIYSDEVFFGRIDVLHSALLNRAGLVLRNYKDFLIKNRVGWTDFLCRHMHAFLRIVSHDLSAQTCINGFFASQVIHQRYEKIHATKLCDNYHRTIGSRLWGRLNLNILDRFSTFESDCEKEKLSKVSRVQPPPIAIFYHLSPLGPWESIVKEQLKSLSNAQSPSIPSLISLVKTFFVGISAKNSTDRDQAIRVLRREITPTGNMTSNMKLRILSEKGCQKNEASTLNVAQRFCGNHHQDYLVLYFHSKGVTHSPNDGSGDWRRYMSKFVIEKHFDSCVHALQGGQYDVCGVEFSKSGVDSSGFRWGPHFSGNFWWATCKHLTVLRALDPCSDNRYLAETWVASKFDTRIRNLWHTGFPESDITWRGYSSQKSDFFRDTLAEN